MHVTNNDPTAATDSAAAPGLRIDRVPRPDDLMAVVHAVPIAVPAARQRVRRWLDTLGWPVERAEDIELAVNEAIANVVDHAYPPDARDTATLHAWVSVDPRTRERRVVVAVTDRGRWAAYQPDSPSPAARGHGLVMMSGCMAELHIQRSAAGTTVIMISAAVPPDALC
jgi:anti-sigma regulatory factor (Ser/Thr protein kinase)